MSTYRVDHHQPQNVYRDEQYIGVMFTAEDAALAVEALNEVERVHGPALPIAVAVPTPLISAEFDELKERFLASIGKPPTVLSHKPDVEHARGAAEALARIADRFAELDLGPLLAREIQEILAESADELCAERPHVADACTCAKGRTCPRHGAVM